MRLPALFLAHAAPTFAVETNATTAFWEELPAMTGKPPKALLCISAHWETAQPRLSSCTSIQHDFYGFSDALYRLDWPLQEDREVTAWLHERMQQLDIEVALQNDRALDHGVWVPLMRAWPEPPFPVFQLSLSPGKGCSWHCELGQKLLALRDEGVLVVSSGGICHNLKRLDWHADDNIPSAWAATFMQEVDEAIRNRDFKKLYDPWQMSHGRDCVPTIEHYLPLLVMLGMAGKDKLALLHQGWQFGSLSLHCYGLGVEART